MHPGMVACLAQYPGSFMPYMGYGMHPYDMPFGEQGYMFPPIPPQRYVFVASFEP